MKIDEPTELEIDLCFYLVLNHDGNGWLTVMAE
jgi:hypothetical protein